MSKPDETLAAGVPFSCNSKTNLLVFALSTTLLLAAVSSDDHVRSKCAMTLYPELCETTISTAVGSSSKEAIEASVNITIGAVGDNYRRVKKLLKTENSLTKREKIALHDCLETGEETLRELYEVVEDVNEYPNKKSLSRYADDLKTLLSSAITNQETCLDGFSHDKADKKVRESLKEGLIHIEKLCSIALALIKNLTDTDIANLNNNNNHLSRKQLKEKNTDDRINWPDWMSPNDRRLLQASSTATPDVVVAADGSGDFRTISEAVAAAPHKLACLMFNVGFEIAAAVGERFLARDVTFQNTAGPSKHQAVALRVGSDLSAFYRCDMLAYQDTLYVHSNRQFYVQCIIVGTIDFIFGNAAAVIQDCDIHARRPNPGQRNMVTAQGRTDPNQNTGIVIQKCRIGTTSDLRPVISNFPTFLGRPWQRYSRTVVMQTSISNVIDPAGWHVWDGNFALDTQGGGSGGLHGGEFHRRRHLAELHRIPIFTWLVRVNEVLTWRWNE